MDSHVWWDNLADTLSGTDLLKILAIWWVVLGESNMLSFNLNNVGKFFRPAFLILSRLFCFASPGLLF